MELADPRSLPLLTELLDDATEDGLLGISCSTIAELGDKSHIPALQRLRQRASDDVKRDCDEAILTLKRK